MNQRKQFNQKNAPLSAWNGRSFFRTTGCHLTFNESMTVKSTLQAPLRLQAKR
jgi:hypothetical protein